MSNHRTARGREFNMQGFVSDKGKTTAVGNSNRNAQGDLLGRGGQVVATAKEVTNAVYNNNNRPGSKKVKLDPMEQEIGRKDIIGADGVGRVEITYADGSVEIQTKEGAPAPSKPIDFDFRDISKDL